MHSPQLKTIIWTVALACVVSVGLVFPGAVLAGQNKVDVCHMEGNGDYHLITIAEPAYEARIAHGDATVGESVPNMPGYKFGEDCTLELDCPCEYINTSHIEWLIDYWIGEGKGVVCELGRVFEFTLLRTALPFRSSSWQIHLLITSQMGQERHAKSLLIRPQSRVLEPMNSNS